MGTYLNPGNDGFQMIRKGNYVDKTGMIEAAYITGILPIKKYGKQSALSDFLEYTMVQPEPMEEYVGFTEREVRDLCENTELEIVTETFQNDMVHINSKDDVLTLLVHLGYMAYDSEKQTVYIPNKELQQEFIRTVKME